MSSGAAPLTSAAGGLMLYGVIWSLSAWSQVFLVRIPVAKGSNEPHVSDTDTLLLLATSTTHFHPFAKQPGTLSHRPCEKTTPAQSRNAGILQVGNQRRTKYRMESP